MPLGFRQAGLAFAGDPDRKKCTAFSALQERRECEGGRIRGKNAARPSPRAIAKLSTGWKGGRGV